MDRDSFKDKVVVVTGAASCIGREIALAYARCGCSCDGYEKGSKGVGR